MASKTSAWNYAPGTTAYATVAASQGDSAAQAQWQAAIKAEQNQTPLDTSTWDAFATQIVTDPLAAPAQTLNNQLSNVFKNIVTQPFVLLLVIGLVITAFFYFGGAALIKRKRTA